MRPASLLPALVLALAFCTMASAAPTAKLSLDRSEDAPSVFPGEPIDLLVRVDPGEEGVALDGLTAAVEGEARFGETILPPPDGEGVYREPFAIRIPMTAGEGRFTATARVTGKTGKGEAFALEAERKIRTDVPTERHVTGTVDLEKVPAIAGEPNALVLRLSVIEGYHVYGEEVEYGLPFTAELVPNGPARLWSGGGRVVPPGKEIHGDFTLKVPFTPLVAGRVEARVALFWQACTEELCDPNWVAYMPATFDVEPGSGVVAPADDSDDLGSLSLWKLILASIGGALFALAMPCTYPLIPITISFFTKQAEAEHHRVVPLALAYGGGIVAIFAGIGLFVGTAAFSAENVLDFATNRWVNGIFALLFLVFGLSLVGLFDIRLPGWFDNVAAKAGSGGGYLGVFAMGATLVITSFTCTAPIVGGLLVWVAQSGDWQTATLCMAVFGLTMAVPFVFLSLSPKAIQNLPKSGVWMKHLKVTLGILEMGLALKFISNVDLAIETYAIGRELFLVLWAASFLAAGLYLLGAFDLLRKGVAWSLTRGRGIAGAAMLAITAYLLTGLSGPLEPKELEGFFPRLPEKAGEESEHSYGKAFAAVVIDDYAEGVRVAKEKGLPIFLHFTGFQ